MRGISALLVSVWIMVLLGYFLLPNSTASAAGATPNVFEILSYGGDITFIGGSGMTKMLVIGAEEFQAIPEASGLSYAELDDTVWMTSPQHSLIAAVDLPDGATVTQIDCALIKFGPLSDSQCELRNSQYGDTSSLVMAVANTVGLPSLSTTIQFISSSSITDSIIDRDSKNYWIDFEGLDFCGIGCRLNSVKITYTVPSGMVVGGEFYPVDNVSLVLAYGLVNSWWMAPIGIGIGVGIYLVKRRF